MLKCVRFVVWSFLLHVASSAHGAILNTDLIAWWELDDTSDSSPSASRTLQLKDGATLSGGALVLDTDPSNNRAATGAFNPTDSFSIFIDFQADTLPSGGIDPQYILLSNIGDDAVRSFSQFSTSAGYMIFLRPNRFETFQKTGGSFAGAVGASLPLADPTGRHRAVINWEFNSSTNEYRSVLFLDGSSITTASGFGPMNFGTGTATNSLLLGTNVDEAFQTPRTLDGTIFEAAIFNRSLTVAEIDQLAVDGVQPVPEPSTAILVLFALTSGLLSRRTA